MNDIEKKLEDLKAEFLEKLEELQKEAEAQKKQKESKPWKPESGERYYCVNQCCKVIHYDFMRNYVNFDNMLISCGNYFRTEARAEQVAKKMRLLLRLEQLHDMICPDYVPDWNAEKDKFCLCYNHEGKKWGVGRWLFFENQGFVCFDTFENAEKAAEILNKELEESK